MIELGKFEEDLIRQLELQEQEEENSACLEETYERINRILEIEYNRFVLSYDGKEKCRMILMEKMNTTIDVNGKSKKITVPSFSTFTIENFLYTDELLIQCRCDELSEGAVVVNFTIEDIEKFFSNDIYNDVSDFEVTEGENIPLSIEENLIKTCSKLQELVDSIIIENNIRDKATW